MTDRIYELIERVYKAQIMEKEYELKALEAHVNPIFYIMPYLLYHGWLEN